LRRDRLRVVVSGMLAANPRQGGATWAVLQYALGLRALGHDVWLAEPVNRLDATVVEYFHAVIERFGLRDRAALVVPGTKRTAGMPYDRLAAVAADADVLLNISGLLADEALMSAPARVWLDLDPGFNQLWHAQEGIEMGFDGHTHFATVGLAMGTPECTVPSCGRRWLTSPPPVVLDHWALADGPGGPVTTVGNWRSYGSIEHADARLGQRAHTVRELVDLPGRTDERLVLAIAIDDRERADLCALEANGWELTDPVRAAGTPERYAHFIRGSKAEIGLPKSGYVVTRSGWFSDRSACYLASGRPVVARDTGFGIALPTGEGLLVFGTAEEAAEGLARVAADPKRHRRAARAIAEEHLDARRVLRRLLERVGA
jgi:hypothetical protein